MTPLELITRGTHKRHECCYTLEHNSSKDSFMKVFFGSLLFVLCLNTFAATQNVLTITNDIDTNIMTITVQDDGAEFKTMTKEERTNTGSLVNRGEFELKDLQKAQTMQVKSGRDVVKIKFSSGFDPAYGGAFTMNYLVNGVTGERKNLELDLRRNGAKWEVTVGNKLTKKLHVIGNRKAIVGVVGIAEIQVR